MAVMTRLRAFAIGFAVLAALDAFWLLVLLDAPGAAAIRMVLMFSPAIAAFLTIYLTPSGGFLLGTAHGTSAVVLSFISMSIYESFGFRHDKIGGPAETFIILWLWCTALAIVGSTLAITLKAVSEAPLKRNLERKKLSEANFRLVGFLLVTFFVLSTGFLGSVGDYVYERLGISRNIALHSLWLMPVVIGVLSAFSSERHKLLTLGLLILFLGALGSLTHSFGWSSVPEKLDTSALNVALQHLVLGTMTIGLGWVIGFLLSQKKRQIFR